MALVESTMVPLGMIAPTFELIEPATSTFHSVPSLVKSKGLLVMFICNHCPYVKHIKAELYQLGLAYADSDIGIVAINANDADAYPQDAPDRMAELDYPFPYLFDESQLIARSFGAECTPDFFLYDQNLECVYRGEFDDSRPGNQLPVTGSALREALDALISGQPASGDQRPSIGCNIKWR